MWKLNLIFELLKPEGSQSYTPGRFRINDFAYLTDVKTIASEEVEKINGVSCIHIGYKRQLHDKPFVLVHIYYFHNNDRVHALTLSYRLSEVDYWREDFAKILKSFRITTIR
jgi:hypothetical protein